LILLIFIFNFSVTFISLIAVYSIICMFRIHVFNFLKITFQSLIKFQHYLQQMSNPCHKRKCFTFLHILISCWTMLLVYFLPIRRKFNYCYFTWIYWYYLVFLPFLLFVHQYHFYDLHFDSKRIPTLLPTQHSMSGCFRLN